MMSKETIIDEVRSKIRLRHFAYSTEQAYCGWVARFYDFALRLPKDWTSERKVEEYLTDLARRRGVSPTTQNQALMALVFLYGHVLGRPLGKVDALRAKRRQHERMCPSREHVALLRGALVDTPTTPARLLFDLLYGCGLRVSEPLEIRIRDILIAENQIIIRNAKGAKDRRVPIPRCCLEPLKRQIARAETMWQWDRHHAPLVGAALPHLLAKKYPNAPFAWQWFWLFPAPNHCDHPRTGQRVRYHLLSDALQRSVLNSARKVGLEGMVTPHCLRHAYATHQLAAGVDVRTVQVVMGHVSLETTAGYVHADVAKASNPLDSLAA